MDALTVEVSEITRPSITFEEIKQPDGSLKPGRMIYHAVAFSSSLDPFTHSGFCGEVTLVAGVERWLFHGAAIALAPQSGHGADNNGRFQYVMTYSGFKRLSDR